MRELTSEHIESIATGAAVLGTGGGGDPHVGKLMAKQAIEKNGPVTLLDPEEVPDDALVVPSAMMGAPTVMLEKLPRGTEPVEAFEALERYVGQEAYATMSIEAGGLNSTIPLGVAATLDVPIVDADGMGRAFPEIPQTTLTLGGIDATPMSMADEKGNSLFLETVDNAWTETFSRSISVDMGGSAMIAIYSHTGAETKAHAIHGSLSLAEEIGRTIRTVDERAAAPIEVLAREFDGHHLFSGKVTDVKRRTTEGFAQGTATIEGLDAFDGHELTLEFQNEFLIAETEDEILATAPDLISIIEKETGQPVTTEELKYGYRVDVLGLECADPWRTAAGIELGGPAFFGYETEYVPIEQRAATSDIIHTPS
ncbi:DUF917 domain-containing protein [Haloplanus pelagicus]|jgi:DUF917 family protein|uniref:DUF917 domain-containing protein n=1 Tax=Haloplanus pelagicus TaxID=2949995 RepID=UPI00203B8ABC|nr:DUF917 domain-containing protein [Haloplanus sp. HW8-1]